MNQELIKVSHLTVNYEKVPVLWDIEFSIPTGGHLVAIIGPNGAGKSTLLKALMGFVKKTSGLVQFFGEPFEKAYQKVAYMPQRGEIDWDFPITAYEVVLMGALRKAPLGFASKASRIKAKEALEKVGMLKFEKKPIGCLSGGQQQRLFIARALMQEADVYLMDEPFAGIDAATEAELFTLFHELKSQGKTLIIVHHDLATVEKYFDWAIILNSCLIACGPIASTFSSEILMKAYGRNPTLFNEALRRNLQKQTGL
jgi:manganese/zinc/iron transport system ATP- binding protein